MTKLWIKTPYPGEEPGEGTWHECTTWYETRVFWPKYNKNKKLPTAKQKEMPND